MKKVKCQIADFPSCFFRSKELTRIDSPVRTDTGYVVSTNSEFYLNGRLVISFKKGSGLADSRVEYVRMSMNNAKMLKTMGFEIKPVPVKNFISLSESEIIDFRVIESEFYSK